MSNKSNIILNIDYLWSEYLKIPETDVKDSLNQMNDYFTYYLTNMIKKEFIQKKTNIIMDDILNIIQSILDNKNIKTKNKLFNLKDVAGLGFNLAPLHISNNLHKFLSYYNNDYDVNKNFNFNMTEIQSRISKYSYGFIKNDFPFRQYNYIIAGGFVLNCITGINSDYSDIDIYIFNDFKNSVLELTNYFKTISNFEMTYNKSIINIYPIGYKINIQIINVEGSIPEKIISDFDLSYSQMALFNWNIIKLTFPAYKTLVTGLFTINRNAIIRNYRIIKGYIKGFKLDQNEFIKIQNNDTDNEQINILNEVKNFIYKMYKSFNNNENIEQILITYLKNNSNDYKLMTKSIHLTKEFTKSISKKDLIEYLEANTKYKYIENINNCTDMEPIKSFINYDSIFDFTESNQDLKNYNFPNMYSIDYIQNNHYLYFKNVNDYIDLYKLYVETSSYYKNYKPLNYYSINIICNLYDLKITSFTYNLIKFEIKITNNEYFKNLISDLDSRFESLSQKIYKHKNPDINQDVEFKKIIQNNTQETITIVTSPSIFIKNLIYQNKKNILTYNKDLKRIKRTFNNICNTLDIIKNCSQIIKLKLCIEGIIYNKKFNYFTYQLKIISLIT
jgi:hypothetical protein